jgi:TPR repeat protein
MRKRDDAHVMLKRAKAAAWKRLKGLYVEAYGLLREGRDPSYRKAIPILRKLAARGDSWAKYQLGLAYDKGYGARRNKRWAMYWYEAAAKDGYDSAQLNLGILLANAAKPLRNEQRAVDLYRAAALQGNRNAAYNLGLYYGEGRGVRKSLSASRRWYGMAARLGDRDARAILRRRVRAAGRARRKRTSL